jgi:hypothetical protein
MSAQLLLLHEVQAAESLPSRSAERAQKGLENIFNRIDLIPFSQSLMHRGKLFKIIIITSAFRLVQTTGRRQSEDRGFSREVAHILSI